ncbi:ABC transporter ATP-binding protein [Rhodospirillum rubrum]|uniref:Oligopeptide/dipeptide ABC transporter, ATP-binding protein-like n=1 Tax=Rhodospirillum rubrum (strain ATCC 11170 / ATH 1.1.1 / DSM 467 / LMG 4362 / NCIMB 8255 / S1) TaxID=269796 RepID=Q2RWV2_RHORT|nr:oligopeptide/dipeptide ABC transporter ATP-binding protein [Rhodospirillum rubrum]ABC21393.1 Oligopeptide/dipeptide ABC transporter, ATP-binding protein-like [Rhodospirillum rubrum ATCC 11170]AEO47073.1 oligopeptide/dipeptide ABC transporter ATP-binding protein-like protein [Rhodospirillum rubrum F11]MBK5952986.1 ABC transporter ATP-binding protein [Rhodospirillum rubrum]QXG81071.1 ATP-binding cassette domain-containing protein [Rhodospirillum rubrum]HAP98530.1 ABC transporter ATP-binding p
MTETPSPILEVTHLDTRFSTPDGEVKAVNDLSFTLNRGETLAVVGESGSGKTQIFLSLMGLLARNGQVSGRALFCGQDLLKLSRRELNAIRGSRMAMIFQDPMTALNPFLTVERQMTEVLIEHKGLGRAEARAHSIGMLEKVGIPEAARRIGLYPHEFSGGMRQRVMIAIALLCSPEVLIADEPTTALDVTVQAQILALLNTLKAEIDTAIVLITHDLGVVAGLADRVLVLYGGRIAETGTVDQVFYDARHPYTHGLLRSMPRLDGVPGETLYAIPGQPPNLQNLPAGCAFQDRCSNRMAQCAEAPPPPMPIGAGRLCACYFPHDGGSAR